MNKLPDKNMAVSSNYSHSIETADINNDPNKSNTTANYNSHYDNVFKSMKCNNTSLFIPVINENLGKNYSSEDKITILPSEGDITKLADGKADINSRTSDFLLKIRNEVYLLECQSYNDGTMAIRIAEYAFIYAKQYAVWENGRVFLEMPNYCVIYIKSNNSTPEYTKITYKFPDGRLVDYDAKNMILKNYSKEEIIKKRLYPYIPYYILRYESDIKGGNISLDFIEEELTYLLEGLEAALAKGYIDTFDFYNIKAFTNTVIEHFATGKNKERLVNIMGGQIITTEADIILNQGFNQGLEQGLEQGKIEQYIEDLKEFGVDDARIIMGLINKFQLSKKQADDLLSKSKL